MDMEMSVEPWYPGSASETDLAGYHRICDAVQAEADPAAARPSVADVVGALRAPDRPSLPRRFWVARAAGGGADGASPLVGLVITFRPRAENTDAVIAQIRVLPEARRRGVGGALLAALLDDPELCAGRRRLVGFFVPVGGPGARWLTGLGFECTEETVVQTLLVPETDPELWSERSAPVAAGFELVSWSGSAPGEWVAEFARVRGAIADAPVGESAVATPRWTPARVREREDFELGAGRDLWVVAARESATGRFAGFTEMIGYREPETMTQQADTAVLAEYRGLGLGRAMKAAMMRRLAGERPRLERVVTFTSAENRHMIAVNRRLGYATTQRNGTFESAIEALRERVVGRRMTDEGGGLRAEGLRAQG